MESDGLISPVVVKVGGSLFDLPDLARRLGCWLEQLQTRQVLLVPGGGAMVDLVRELDRCHDLGQEKAHWLALRVLGLNAAFLVDLLPAKTGRIVADAGECLEAWEHGLLPVLEGHAFARGDEGQAGCLPHHWNVTSDSLAARAAAVLKARRLVLLKSVTIPERMGWDEASRLSFVDAYFAETLANPQTGKPAFEVQAVNLREWQS